MWIIFNKIYNWYALLCKQKKSLCSLTASGSAENVLSMWLCIIWMDRIEFSSMHLNEKD